MHGIPDPTWQSSRGGVATLMATAGLVIDCEPGDLVFRQGDPADRFFVVVSGRVLLFMEGEQQGEVKDRQLAEFGGAGDILALGALASCGTYPLTAEAAERSNLLAITRDGFDQLLRERRDLILPVLDLMSHRLRNLLRRVSDLKMRTAAERLAAHLLALHEHDVGSADVCLPCSKELLAQELGMRPETLSRALCRLRALGILTEGSGAGYRIHNLAALRHYVSHGEQSH